jgi:hypothetical protein
MIEGLKELFGDRLNKVFQYYCLYGEPLNCNKMKSSKFIKFLRDTRILLKGVLKIPEEGIDRLYQQENVNNSNGKKTSK